MTELEKEIKEQVHAWQGEGPKSSYKAKQCYRGLQQGQAGCRALKRPGKILHRFTTTLLINDENVGEIWNTWHAQWGKGKTQAFGTAIGIP